ncbi:MAG: beta-propeller domain-containing protein, partial [Candidatus Poseidoniales archaeon]
LQDDGDGGLNQIGYIGDIAPGERIWSARFVGERAYLVTFENIDPLWVIDLSDPTNPTILGELEVPGVSTYIHPISDNLLLTIGIGPGPDGLGLDWSITQVSLFDVTDPTTPI